MLDQKFPKHAIFLMDQQFPIELDKFEFMLVPAAMFFKEYGFTIFVEVLSILTKLVPF